MLILCELYRVSCEAGDGVKRDFCDCAEQTATAPIVATAATAIAAPIVAAPIATPVTTPVTAAAPVTAVAAATAPAHVRTAAAAAKRASGWRAKASDKFYHASVNAGQDAGEAAAG